jgi:hypothetical protein
VQKIWLKTPAKRVAKGTLIFLGVIVLGVLLGIGIIFLPSMPQKGEQIYDLMDRGEAIAAPARRGPGEI